MVRPEMLVSRGMNAFKTLVALFVFLVGCRQEIQMIAKNDPGFQLENGVLFYKSQRFNGVLFEKYEDGSFKKQIPYENGRKDGREQWWYGNGQLSQRRYYEDGVKVGNHQGWWEDGSAKFEYSFNSTGAYHGKRKEWYRNGQMVRDFNYLNGKEIGKQQMWTDAGKIRANYVVKDGERFGLIGLKKCYTVTVDKTELQ